MSADTLCSGLILLCFVCLIIGADIALYGLRAQWRNRHEVAKRRRENRAGEENKENKDV